MKRKFGKGCIVAVCLGLALAFSGCTKKEEAPEAPAQETPAEGEAPADATAPADEATPAEGEAPAADAAAPADAAPATPAQ